MKENVFNTKKLYEKLEKKTGLDSSQLYQKGYKFEQKHGSLPKGAGIGYIATLEGISLNKFFPHDVIAKIFSLKKTLAINGVIKNGVSVKSKSISSPKIEVLEIKVDKSIDSISEPLLPGAIIRDAKKMATVYPLIYVFENSIRNFIDLCMTQSFGSNWWEEKIENHPYLKKSIADIVNGRKKQEDSNRFHSRRGAHSIYYTDLPDLRLIIEQFFPEIKKYINQRKSFIENMIETINLSRQIIAHNNPISDQDINRIKINLKDWCKQLEFTKEKLQNTK